jgi:hypothetical protein
MIKSAERSNTNSCWNKAWDDELVFVLLERDESTPVAIRAWVADRLKRGKNKPNDPQIVAALEDAHSIELNCAVAHEAAKQWSRRSEQRSN